jgi:radical SAM superfamily enzyme YgiQ (UPF0313 family)
MRIALIDPQYQRVNSNRPMREFLASSPYMYFYTSYWSGFSTGLLTLASLTPHHHEIRYIDENYEAVPFEEEFDVVAITATTQQADRAYQIADRFKAIWGKRTILAGGGAHVSYLPEEAKRHFDVVFIGEAERTWPLFVSDVHRKRWRSTYSASEFPPVDLMELPPLRYDLLKPENYKMLWLQTRRGCPRHCEFCSASQFFGRRQRARSVDQIVRDIRHARRYFRVQPIYFSDDNMLPASRGYAELLEALRELRISYVMQGDIGIGRDVRRLDALKDSGCATLFIGFESLEEQNLRLMNRDQWKLKRLPYYEQYTHNIVQAGIGVFGAFILGYDCDSTETFRKTGDFVVKNYLSGAQLSLPTPLPGTAFRARLEREGRILPTTWANYTYFDVNIVHPRLGKEQLENGLADTYGRIYCKEYLDRKNLFYKEIHRRRFSALK